jgi:hypothetical protein
MPVDENSTPPDGRGQRDGCSGRARVSAWRSISTTGRFTRGSFGRFVDQTEARCRSTKLTCASDLRPIAQSLIAGLGMWQRTIFASSLFFVDTSRLIQ